MMVLVYFNIFYLRIVFSFGSQSTHTTVKSEISTAQKTPSWRGVLTTFLWVSNIPWFWLFKDAETCCNKYTGWFRRDGQYLGEWEKVCISMCLILNGYRDRAVWISRPNSVRFLVAVWMKSEIYKRKLVTRAKFLAPMLDAAARIKKRADQFRRRTPDFRTLVA
jgi:hypothetical protein